LVEDPGLDSRGVALSERWGRGSGGPFQLEWRQAPTALHVLTMVTGNKKEENIRPKANSRVAVDLYWYTYKSTGTQNRYLAYGIYTSSSCSEHSRMQNVERLRLLKQSRILALITF